MENYTQDTFIGLFSGLGLTWGGLLAEFLRLFNSILELIANVFVIL